MCLGGGGGGGAPAVDPDVEIERENQEAEEQRKKEKAKQKQLEETVARKRGGTGMPSLLTSQAGGIGYYNETLAANEAKFLSRSCRTTT